MLIQEIVRRSPASAALLLWMALMPLVFSTATGYQGWAHSEFLSALTPAEWAWFYLLSIFTMALALTPTTFVAAMSGYFMGFESLWYLVPSYMLASLVGYFLSQQVGKQAINTVLATYPRSKRVLEGLNRNAFWLVVMCRISPVLPFAIMNVVLGYASVPVGAFLSGGLVGMLPRTIMAVALGTQLTGLAEGNWSSLLWVVFLLASIAGLGWLFRRALRSADGQ